PFPTAPRRRGPAGPAASGNRSAVGARRCCQTTRAAIARNQHALLRFERAPASRRTERAEVHRPDTRNHNRAPGIGHPAASSRNPEHRTVDKAPTQFGETFLPLLLALLFGRADLGGAVSGGRRCGISGWLNRKRTHQERAEIVGAAHLA